jgi:hypothetical protein
MKMRSIFFGNHNRLLFRTFPLSLNHNEKRNLADFSVEPGTSPLTNSKKNWVCIVLLRKIDLHLVLISCLNFNQVKVPI